MSQLVQDAEMPTLRRRWERLMFVQQLSYVTRATGQDETAVVERFAAMTLDDLRENLDPETFAKLCDMIGD